MLVEECYLDMNQSHIIRFVDADVEIPSNYIMVIGKQTLLLCSSLLAALFVLFAVHYVFNMEYHPKVKDFYLFFQNKLFNIKDSASHSTNYINITSSIECFLVDKGDDSE